MLLSGGSSTETCSRLSPGWPSAAASRALPAPPPAVRAIAASDWALLDPGFLEFARFLPEASGYRAHLVNTYAMLHNWHQTRDVARAGLFHMTYGAPGLILLPNMGLEKGSKSIDAERAALRRLVGHDAEELVALFSSDAFSWERLATTVVSGVPPSSATLLGGEQVPLRRLHFAQLALVAVADIAECMHETAAPEDADGASHDQSVYYSSSFRPGLELYWMSQLLREIREDLLVAPPIFEGCTRTLGYEQEQQARNLYWEVVQEHSRTRAVTSHEVRLLEDAMALNPFVAEPHVLMAQLKLQQGRWAEASQHAASGLQQFYAWGTAWDKRAPLRQWVAFTMTLFMEASRREQGCGSPGPALERLSSILPLPEYGVPLA